MDFDWGEFITLAKNLTNKTGNSTVTEAAYRSAISRAYFGTFCHARNYARDNLNFIPDYSEKDHIKLKEHFRSRNMAPFAVNLDQLRIMRNRCDYENQQIENIDNMATSAISKSTYTIGRLNKKS